MELNNMMLKWPNFTNEEAEGPREEVALLRWKSKVGLSGTKCSVTEKKITINLSGRHFILKRKQVHLTAPTLDNSVLCSSVVFKSQYNFILWANFWIIFKFYNVYIFLYCRKHNCHFLYIRIVFYFIVYYLLRHFHWTWLACCLWASAPEWHKFGFSILQVNLFVSCGDRNSDYLKPKNGIVWLIYLGSPRLLPVSGMAGCGDLNYVIRVYFLFLYFLLCTLNQVSHVAEMSFQVSAASGTLPASRSVSRRSLFSLTWHRSWVHLWLSGLSESHGVGKRELN